MQTRYCVDPSVCLNYMSTAHADTVMCFAIAAVAAALQLIPH